MKCIICFIFGHKVGYRDYSKTENGKTIELTNIPYCKRCFERLETLGNWFK